MRCGFYFWKKGLSNDTLGRWLKIHPLLLEFTLWKNSFLRGVVFVFKPTFVPHFWIVDRRIKFWIFKMPFVKKIFDLTPTIYSLYIVFVSTWQKFLLNLYINILQKNPNNKDSTFQLLKNGTWYVFAQSAKKGQRILVKKVSRKVAALSLTYSTHTHLVQNSVKNTPLHNLPYFSNKKTHRPKNWYVVKK